MNKVVKAEAAGTLETESRNFLDGEARVSGCRMVILSNEERLRDKGRGKEETRRGFGSETGG